VCISACDRGQNQDLEMGSTPQFETMKAYGKKKQQTKTKQNKTKQKQNNSNQTKPNQTKTKTKLNIT